jgi:hypothetical protein
MWWAYRGQVMSYNNPLPLADKKASADRRTRENVQVLVRGILWASLAAIFFVLVVPGTASAADLRVPNYHAKAHKHVRKIAYYGCRTGWWQSYCDGMKRPRWATRCR